MTLYRAPKTLHVRTCTKSQPFIKPCRLPVQILHQPQWTWWTVWWVGAVPCQQMGMNINRQETAQELQDGPTQVTGKTRTNRFSLCFCGFQFLASACVICTPLWGWIVVKDCYKTFFVYAEGRIFRIQLLSELQDKGWNDWRGKSMHEISFHFINTKPLWLSRGLHTFS